MENSIPKKSAVKKHFKNAEEVKSFGIYKKTSYRIFLATLVFDEETESYFCDTDDIYSDCCLWDKENGYATILK